MQLHFLLIYTQISTLKGKKNKNVLMCYVFHIFIFVLSLLFYNFGGLNILNRFNLKFRDIVKY